MTPLQQLYDDWRDCRRCHLADGRKNVVMIRGEVPCQVLFVGEAPAHSEDVLGIPLVGPAGHLQDSITADALPEGVTFAYANIVGCLSLDNGGKKVHKPDDTAVQKCSPRLREIVRLCDPSLIVCLGDVAQQYLMHARNKVELDRDVPMVEVLHPAAIGRARIVEQGLMRQRVEVQIRDAVEKYVLGSWE